MKKIIDITSLINKYIWDPIVDGFTYLYYKTKFAVFIIATSILIIGLAIKILKFIVF